MPKYKKGYGRLPSTIAGGPVTKDSVQALSLRTMRRALKVIKQKEAKCNRHPSP